MEPFSDSAPIPSHRKDILYHELQTICQLREERTWSYYGAGDDSVGVSISLVSSLCYLRQLLVEEEVAQLSLLDLCRGKRTLLHHASSRRGICSLMQCLCVWVYVLPGAIFFCGDSRTIGFILAASTIPITRVGEL